MGTKALQLREKSLPQKTEAVHNWLFNKTFGSVTLFSSRLLCREQMLLLPMGEEDTLSQCVDKPMGLTY